MNAPQVATPPENQEATDPTMPVLKSPHVLTSAERESMDAPEWMPAGSTVASISEFGRHVLARPCHRAS